MGENMSVQDELELLKKADDAFQKMVRKEKRRLIKLLKDSNTPEAQVKMLEPVTANVAWMKVKLDSAMEQLRFQPVTNKVFKEYESLWRAYMQGMNKILDALPEQKAEAEIEKEEEQAPTNILELVRMKHKKEA